MVAKTRFGEMEAIAGDANAAERRYREAFRILDGIKETQYLSLIAVELGEVLYRLGRYDDALECATISRRTAAIDNFVVHGAWRALTSKMMARQGQLGRAIALAQEAVAIGANSDYLNWRALWYMDLGEVLALAELPERAADTLRRALDLYEQKGNLVMAGRAQTTLDAMEVQR
jgi:tetratricopeptide (TPR) repeat protein